MNRVQWYRMSLLLLWSCSHGDGGLQLTPEHGANEQGSDISQRHVQQAGCRWAACPKWCGNFIRAASSHSVLSFLTPWHVRRVPLTSFSGWASKFRLRACLTWHKCAEAEFRAYHLLSLMGQHGKFKGDQQAFLSMLQVRALQFCNN